MKRVWNRLMELEPAVVFASVRAIAYIAVGATGAWLSPDNVEPILTVVGALLGVDAATTAATRSQVTPVRKQRPGGPR